MSLLERKAEKFKAKIARKNGKAERRIALQYARVRKELVGDILQLTKRIQQAQARGDRVSYAWLQRQGRLAQLLAQVDLQVARFARDAGEVIREGQGDVLKSVRRDARELLEAAQGHNPVMPAREFATLNTAAVEEFVGRLSDGSPLDDLLRELAPQAVKMVGDRLILGVVRGENPLKVARDLSKLLDIPGARARTIARTTILGTYRAATLDTYRKNAQYVSGWRWLATLGPRTCAACIALHGREWPLAEKFGSHCNCRCSVVPVVSVPGLETPPGALGPEWFEKQTTAVQRKVLGPSKFALYESGQLQLEQLVGEKYDPRWGLVRWEKSLRQLGYRVS